jgi:hypothetical protein
MSLFHPSATAGAFKSVASNGVRPRAPRRSRTRSATGFSPGGGNLYGTRGMVKKREEVLAREELGNGLSCPCSRDEQCSIAGDRRNLYSLPSRLRVLVNVMKASALLVVFMDVGTEVTEEEFHGTFFTLPYNIIHLTGSQPQIGSQTNTSLCERRGLQPSALQRGTALSMGSFPSLSRCTPFRISRLFQIRPTRASENCGVSVKRASWTVSPSSIVGSVFLYFRCVAPRHPMMLHATTATTTDV